MAAKSKEEKKNFFASVLSRLKNSNVKKLEKKGFSRHGKKLKG